MTSEQKAPVSDDEGGEDEEDNSEDEESEDDEGGDEDFSLDNDHADQSAANQNGGEEDERGEIRFAETEQVLRLSSADYTSQPSNKVKKIANELVHSIFATVSKLVSLTGATSIPRTFKAFMF